MVVCLDYSQPCIDMLQQMHQESCPSMRFIQGDVTELKNVLERNDIGVSFDYVIDKGLMDALMCGEGWDSNEAVLKYFKEAKLSMTSRNGAFVLVSYKITSSTREYLEDVGDRVGIKWELDIPHKSNGRVSFSIGQTIEQTNLFP